MSSLVTPLVDVPAAAIPDSENSQHLAQTIVIRDVSYDVLSFAGDEGEMVVRLSNHRDPSAVYDVTRDEFGTVRCDCPDFLFRAEPAGDLCKHARAVAVAGLIPARRPAALPPTPDSKTTPIGIVSPRPAVEDFAYEAGRSVGLEADGPVEAPPSYSRSECEAFLLGFAQGQSERYGDDIDHLDALDEDLYIEHGEYGEARMAIPTTPGN